jgi:hypothetical protein
MLLSWDNKGKYKAELLYHFDTEPSIIIRFDNNWGDEIIVGVSYDGNLKVRAGNVFKAQVRISSRTPISLDMKAYKELQLVIREARELLGKIKKHGRVKHVSSGDKTLCGITLNNKVWTCHRSQATCKTCLSLTLKHPLPCGNLLDKQVSQQQTIGVVLS